MMMCASAAWGVYERDFVEQEDFEAGICNNVNFDGDWSGLRLNECENIAPILWVPSPSTGVVAMIDARTGNQLASYTLGSSGESWMPCAVAADSAGNAYVACACPDSVGRVVRILASQVSGNAVDTVYEVGSKGGYPTSLAFDAKGYLWVTLKGDCAVAKMNVKTGQVVDQVDVVGRPSAIVAGGQGFMWVLSRDGGTICKINTISCTLTDSSKPDNFAPASVCAAEDGRLWIADIEGGLIDFNTADGTWERYETDDNAAFSGVTIDQYGDVWAASPSTGSVVCFSGVDGRQMRRMFVDNAPTSLSIDSDGYLWALREQSDCAVRIDTGAMAAVSTACVGQSACCGTPFTASMTYKGRCPEGEWRMLVDSKIEGAGWGAINWDSVDGFGGVTVMARTAESPELLANTLFTPVMNGKEITVPNGRYMEVVATLSGNGLTTPVLYSLSVDGKNLAPKVCDAKATIAKILKTDHTMESVGIDGVYDPEGDGFKIYITGITQDEPVSGLGSGDCSPDAICLSGSTVWLRGECDPGTKENPGNGRVYEVSFKAVDDLGAESRGKVKVMVPVTTMAAENALDDSSRYDSSFDPTKTVCANANAKG